MDTLSDSPEAQVDQHFLEAPLTELLESGPITLGQNERHIAARNQAAVLLTGLDETQRQAMTEHPLMTAIADKVQEESGREGYDLARRGWQQALILVGGAMTVEDAGVKGLLGQLEDKYASKRQAVAA